MNYVENAKLVLNQYNKGIDALINARKIDPTAIIAGGAPRDWYFGNLASDIDIFIYFPQYWSLYHLDNKLTDNGFKIVKISTGDNIPDNYKLNRDLRAVYDVTHPCCDTGIQIMALKSSTFTAVDQFPLSICKAWVVPENALSENVGLCTHHDFKRTVSTKTIFKTNHLYGDGNRYVKKILDRFPTYKYDDTTMALFSGSID